MTSCPESVFDIYPDGPCAGELTCSYDIYEGLEVWYFTCTDGRLVMTYDCIGIGGACGITPPAEACLDPYDAGATGDGVQIGPPTLTEAFAPFEDGQMIPVAWGGQGSPMVEFRLALDTIETIDCISYQLTAETSAGTNAQTAGTVRLRCGDSLAMYLVLPTEVIDCDEGVFDLHLELTVEGFGTTTYDLTFQGGGGCWG